MCCRDQVNHHMSSQRFTPQRNWRRIHCGLSSRRFRGSYMFVVHAVLLFLLDQQCLDVVCAAVVKADSDPHVSHVNLNDTDISSQS